MLASYYIIIINNEMSIDESYLKKNKTKNKINN